MQDGGDKLYTTRRVRRRNRLADLTESSSTGLKRISCVVLTYVPNEEVNYSSGVMPAIHELIPNAEDLLSLEPEELAPVLLQYLARTYLAGSIKRGNVFSGAASPGNAYGPFRRKVDEALTGAWIWLEREGMLLPEVGNHDRDWVIISERGRRLADAENFAGYRLASMLPRKTLHPSLGPSIFALFVRGHYDSVVFEAFRAVEVYVREKTGLDRSIIGTDLMRRAFGPNAPLTDNSLPLAEQEATSHLFAGAIGLFKNPTSHRTAVIQRPEDAASLVMFADYLLRLVDHRKANAMSGMSNP